MRDGDLARQEQAAQEGNEEAIVEQDARHAQQEEGFAGDPPTTVEPAPKGTSTAKTFKGPDGKRYMIPDNDGA
jgi:hypothetical protein